ncbi:hypothetical protein [Nocardioides sp. SYSU DS0663]|uniref:hypothetical protein n=1 Tax=Nocardioides sp. SYSU DS0663 TaxID=3416445 RepID=UPI003F4C7967
MKVVAVYTTLLVRDGADEQEVRDLVDEAGLLIRASSVLADDDDAYSSSTVIHSLPEYLAATA